MAPGKKLVESGYEFKSSSSSSNSSMGSAWRFLATLKMQRGGAKPAGSEDVYLLTRSFTEYMREEGVVLNKYTHTYRIIHGEYGVSLPEYQSVVAAGQSACRNLKLQKKSPT